jgi:hypothetical protein
MCCSTCATATWCAPGMRRPEPLLAQHHRHQSRGASSRVRARSRCESRQTSSVARCSASNLSSVTGVCLPSSFLDEGGGRAQGSAQTKVGMLQRDHRSIVFGKRSQRMLGTAAAIRKRSFCFASVNRAYADVSAVSRPAWRSCHRHVQRENAPTLGVVGVVW